MHSNKQYRHILLTFLDFLLFHKHFFLIDIDFLNRFIICSHFGSDETFSPFPSF